LQTIPDFAIACKSEFSRRYGFSPAAGHRSPAPAAGFHRTVLQYVLGLLVASFPIAGGVAAGLLVLLSTGPAVPLRTAVPWHPVLIPGCGGMGRNPCRGAYSSCRDTLP